MRFADKYSDLKLFLRNHFELSKDLRPHAFSPRPELRPTQPFKCGCAAVRDTGTNRRSRNYFHIRKKKFTLLNRSRLLKVLGQIWDLVNRSQNQDLVGAKF